MAVGVVEVLEMVQVQVQQGAVLAAARTGGHALLQPVVQQAPVGQTGEWIKEGELVGLLLGLLAVSDVAPDAVQHGMVLQLQPRQRHLDRQAAAVGTVMLPFKARQAIAQRALHHLLGLVERGAPVGLELGREPRGVLQDVFAPCIAQRLHRRQVAVGERAVLNDPTRVG